jgi:hypothetical protein
MKDGLNPQQRLRRANPVAIHDVPTADSPQGRALLDRILEPGPEPSVVDRQPRRRRRTVLILVPVILAAGLAAGYGIFREVRHPLMVVCYGEADLSADRAIVPATTGGPIAACASLWSPGGQFLQGAQAPPLAACVLDTGNAAVFPSRPGADVCAELGLAPPQAGAPPTHQLALQELQEILSERFLGSCVGEEEAVATARDELARLHLQGWRVVVASSFTQDAPCASVAFDVPRREVQLVPIPAP